MTEPIALADDCAVVKKSKENQESENGKIKFGKAVRRRRRELEMTQEQLSEKADLARTYISNLERGRINPSLETMIKISEALDVAVWALLLNSGL